VSVLWIPFVYSPEKLLAHYVCFMIEKKKKNYLGSQYSALPLVSAVDDFISRQHPLAVASTARQEDVSLQASSSFVLRASEIQLSSFVWINIYIYIY